MRGVGKGHCFLRPWSGTSDGLFKAASVLGGLRRELNEAMNSNACGESPRRFLRFSAAASLGRLELYSMICLRELSSRGNRRESWFRAHVYVDEAISGFDREIEPD